VKFIHTADWQIGKPFAGIGDAHKRSLVQQERGEECREEATQFIRNLEGRFDLRRLARQEKNLKKLLRHSAPAEGWRLDLKHYDFPLYALYKSLKKTVAARKQ